MTKFIDGQIIDASKLKEAIDFVNSLDYWAVLEHRIDGELKYKVVKFSDEIVREIVQKQLTDAVQRVLDNKAQELLYDNCLSVCSYIETGVQKFDDEGKAFRAWRSAVWAKGYEILAQVQAGQREIPTEEELIAELPELVIEYAE